MNNTKDQEILTKYRSNPDLFPRVGILVVSYNASGLLPNTLSRISDEVWEVIDEVFVFDDGSVDDTHKLGVEYAQKSERRDKINVYKNPVNLGYGGNQKVGFQYAIDKSMDYVILLHGDGQYAPELLSELIAAAVFDGNKVVFGSRMLDKRGALRDGMPFYKWVGNQVLTGIQNILLGMNLSEFHSGYRMYATEFLKTVNFLQNSDGFDFDTQIIIQTRIANTPIKELPFPTFYGDELCHVDGIDYAIKILLWTVRYRLHQLHIGRNSIYVAKEDSHYVRKFSPYSSHERILFLCNEMNGMRVLDLGAADSLLAKAFLEQGAKVTAVDIAFDEDKKIGGVEYNVLDLDTDQRLPFDRQFDYIVVADLIEHLRNADEFLSNLKYLLKAKGRLIISTPNIAVWFYRISLMLGRFNYGPRGTLDYTHVRLYTYDTIKALLEESGFRIIKVEPTSLPFELALESVGKSSLVKFVDKVYFACCKIWKRMFAYQFVLECEITHLDASGEQEGIEK